MADGAGVCSGAPTLCHTRLKPEIYKTVDGKTIVEDELLNFLSMKLRTLSQDEIVLLAVNTFDFKSIEASKKVLFEVCQTTQGFIMHKGAQKDDNNVKSCLKVLNECGEHLPHFVSHYLEDLPPVTFTSMDVCSLLGKIEQLHADIGALRCALQLQGEVCSDLRVITTDVNRRVSNLECAGDGTQKSEWLCRPCHRGGGQGQSDVARKDLRGVFQPAPADHGGGNDPRLKDDALALPVSARGATAGVTTESPKWTTVIKKGKPRLAGKAVTRLKTSPVSRKPGKGTAIVGTRVAGNHIKTVTTKQVSVFASRFSPDLDAKTLSEYLKEQLGLEVTCNRIGTSNSRFSSFKGIVSCF